MTRTSLILILIFAYCQSQGQNEVQNKRVGGSCEGCEAVFEYGNKVLSSVDTLPGFKETDQKLKITGTVFQKDGKTPANNVILYIYHTDRAGIYPKKGSEEGWALRHGYLRGWIKTDKTGSYVFCTFRPAAYPQGNEPEHIHITVKEPGKNEYYIDEFVFDDDPFLTESERSTLDQRGGSGIVKPKLEGDIYVTKRDIILGLNIPNYE